MPDDTSDGLLAGLPRESAGRVKADGRRVYRLAGPQLLWWAWVALVLLGFGDLLVEGQHGVPLRYLAGALAVTGALFACTAWPKVIADDDGLTVRNPLRSYRVPWGALRAVSLGESVELQCARTPPKPDKKIYCWAIASPRRARARAELRSTMRRPQRNQPAGYARMPADARQLLRQTLAEQIARELTQIMERARERDPAGAVLSGRWDWLPLAVIVVPLAAFALLMLV